MLLYCPCSHPPIKPTAWVWRSFDETRNGARSSAFAWGIAHGPAAQAGARTSNAAISHDLSGCYSVRPERDQLWSINMRNVTNRRHRRSQAQFDKPTKRQKTTRVQAPWPDQKARQEMSNAEVRLDLGKHSKNRDWQAKW
jgi:hypothetical protein